MATVYRKIWNSCSQQRGILYIDRCNRLTKTIDVGIKIGRKMPKEFILFKWKEITPKKVIEFIKIFSDNCINGEYDYTTTTDNKSMISIKHNTGMKGSIFLKSYLESVILETLRKKPNTEITDNCIIIQF